MIRLYFKTAFRNFGKNKLFSFINLFGLSVSMTAAVLILVWVNNERNFDNYHPDAERIFRTKVNLVEIKWVWEASPLLLAELAEAEIPEIELAARVYPFTGTITFNINEQKFAEKKSAYVDSNWFKIFSYRFVEGSASAFKSSPFSMVLTRSKANQLFGAEPAAGKIIRIDSINYQVQGVIEDNPSNSSFQFDVLMNLAAFLANPERLRNELSWGNFNYLTFLKLKESAGIAAVETKLTGLYSKKKNPDNKTEHKFGLTPLSDLHFETGLTSQSSLVRINKAVVDQFALFAFILLIIGCINYINLTTSKSSLRAKEVSIKKIIGAERTALFIQFVADSLIMTMLALCFSVLLIYILLPFFNVITERNFAHALTSPTVWKVFAVVVPAMVILNGIYPAVILSSFKPLNVLKGITVLQVKDTILRKSLVVVQFSLSLLLIIGTLVIFRQIEFIQKKDTGYNREQVFSFNIPYKNFRKLDQEAKEGLFRNIKSELERESSIAGVAMASASIVEMKSSNSGSADWEGHDPSFVPTIFQLSADEDYPALLGLKLHSGRWFDKNSSSDRHNFILNETAINELGIHQPVLGQRFVFQRDTGTIIGVAKDFNFKSIHEKIQPLVILNNPGWRNEFYVKAVPGKAAQALSKVQQVWDRLAPGDAFVYTFLDEHFDRLYREDKLISMIILVFSIIAVSVSALGLIGLAAFSIDQRRKEVGIRKILGASITHILSVLSADFVKLVLIAIIISFPLGWWVMNKWLNNFAYRIDVGWLVFVFSAAIAFVVVFFTVSLQALKAAIVNPVNSLRNE